MALKVRSRWRLLALAMGVALLGLMVPAQAVTVVIGSSNCATVGSIGAESLTLTDPFVEGPQPGTVGDAVITIDAHSLTRTTFDFTITGGVVYDVIVKGSAANHYHYDGGTVTEDGLTIPNGNKLNVIHFCYTPGEPLVCGGTVETESTDPNASGEFTRDPDSCSGVKLVEIEVRPGNIVAFIPTGGSAGSTYTGVITFRKDSTANSPEGFALQYDSDDEGPVPFRVVPDCDTNGVPPTDHSWCLVSASSSYQGNSLWLFTWNVNGIGDPLFK